MTAFIWSPERDALLTELYASGLTFEAIAEAMTESAWRPTCAAARKRSQKLKLVRSSDAATANRKAAGAKLSEGAGWSDARVDALKRLYSDGCSASQIAKQLGQVSRNAVIGKIIRLGLNADARQRPSAPRQPSVYRQPRAPVVRREHLRTVNARAIAAKSIIEARAEGHVAAPQVLPEASAVFDASAAKTIMDLRPSDCRWIVGPHTITPTFDSLYCGRRVAFVEGERRVYCEDHCREAYRPGPASRVRAYDPTIVRRARAA